MGRLFVHRAGGQEAARAVEADGVDAAAVALAAATVPEVELLPAPPRKCYIYKYTVYMYIYIYNKYFHIGHSI